MYGYQTIILVSHIQHLQDMLDLEMSSVAWMMKCFPEVKEIDDMRKAIGRYGLTGKQQVIYKIMASKMTLEG